MGWWSVTPDHGGIHVGDTGLYNGDGPADVLGPAVDKVVKLYKKSFKRKPYMVEMMAALRFVCGPHELEDQPKAARKAKGKRG